MKKMIFTAIAGGYLVRDFITHYNIAKHSFEREMLTFLSVAYILIIFLIVGEIKAHIQNKKADKKGEMMRKQISYQDCEKKRMIQEFQKQRSEFFEAYFKQPTITMKNTGK